jgi:hypothetical protein
MTENNALVKAAADPTVIEKEKEISDTETKLIDPVPAQDNNPPLEVITKRETDTGIMYLIKYQNGDRIWVEPEEVPTELLMKYTELNPIGAEKLPHKMIKLLLETLERYLEMVRKNPNITLLSMKKKLYSWIKCGGTFLCSTRTIDQLLTHIKETKTKEELEHLVQSWLDKPNFTFEYEWDHLMETHAKSTR